MSLVLERILESQNAAPRLAEQEEVVPSQAESLADLLHFLDEAGGLEQRRIIGLIAVGRAKLVVIVVLDSCRRQVAVERFVVLVRRAGTTVQREQLDAGVVSDALGPDVELAFGSRDLDLAHPTAQGIVTPSDVEVRVLRRRAG